MDENSREGTDVGEPVAARYAGNDPLSYSLAGTGAELFTIDGTGQIKVGKGTDLDHETRDIYTITVRVADRKDADGNPDDAIDDTITATINVKDVNEPPAISGDENLTIVENTAATTLQSYGASDPEGVTTTFTWSLSGADRGDFEISSAGFLTFKNVPDYERPADSGGNNEYNIQIWANDGSLTGTRNVAVTVIDVNEEPTISGDDTLTYPENTATTRVLDRYSATDPEGRPITWTVGGTDAGDFNIDPSGNLYFDEIPDHENPADTGGNNVYDIQVVATDDGYLGDGTASPGGAREKGFNVTVTVTPVNEPPTVTGDTAVSVDENTEAFSLTYTASDPEGDSTTFAWSLSGADGRDFSIDRNKGIVTFRNTPNYESPADGNRDNEYLVTVRVSDGQYTGTLDVTIDVDDVNEPPTITGSATPPDFPENNTRSVATYRATDPERAAITWSVGGTDGDDFEISDTGVLTFTNIPDFEEPADANQDNEYLATVRASDGTHSATLDVTVSVINSTGPEEPSITTTSRPSLTFQENRTGTIYTFRARDPQRRPITWSLAGADWDDFTISSGALTFNGPPDFEHPADANGDNVYELTVVVTDDQGLTDAFDFTVTVTDANEGPEISLVGSAPGGVPENQDRSQVLARYTATDPEGGTVSRWRTSGTDGGDFVINEQGELRFRNTPDYERPADSNRDNAYVFSVQASDGRNYGSFDETVTPVNEPPAITTTGSSATALRQNENVTSRLYTYRATDPEGADTVAWSVGGADGTFFAIDDRGQFSFKEANPPDFEQPADSGGDNVYNVVVQATDDDNNTARLDVTVTVREVNEGPEVTSGSPNFTISENKDLPNAVYEGFDPEGGAVTRWNVGGRDGGDFSISQDGVLTFRSLPDYERPADSNRDNIYELQVRPYDGRYYGSFDVIVTVNDVNEPPAITSTGSSATALRQNENVTSRLYTYRATDPEGADTVAWSVGGADGTFFAIDDRGQFSFKEDNPPDFEQPADSGGDNVYNVVVQATDDDNNTARLDVTVTVANDAEGVEPTISTRRPPSTYRENGTSAVYTFRASDPQRGPISWSLQGPDSGDFIITGDGGGRALLAFSGPPDYENPADSDGQNDYELTVIATNEDSHIDRLSFTITVTEVDEGPEVSGPSTFTIGENRNLSDSAYTARDPEGLKVARWSVGGRDGGDFFITQGGTLYLRSLPDYERPADSNRDNVYEATIQPSDGRNTGSYPVTVTVANVDEPPEIRNGGKTSFMQQENRTSRLYTFSATDPEGADTVAWSVGGVDATFFAIDEGGQFSFREENPPDFDNPADVDGDNLYNVTIEARDPESNTARLAVTVLITEVNEGPVITRDGNLFGSPPGTVPENQAATLVLATYAATDPERPGVKITQWSAAGRDGGDFVINALGQLRFRNPPDFERPADSDRDNIYEVTIRASDGRNTGTLEEVQRLTVSDIDEAPVITTISRTAFSQAENRISTLYTFRATDPEGGTVTWTPAGPDGRHFAIDERGALSFANPPDFESPTDSGRDNVYDVTVQARDAALKTAGLNVTVTVTDDNEGVEPTISTRRPPATYRENGTSAVYTFRATDPQQGTTITWTLEGTDRGDFTLTADSSGRGVLSFNSPPDFESPADADRDNIYELEVAATDDEGNSDRLDFAISVTDDNEGVEPTISTRRPPATYRENDTRTVYTFRANDPQRDTVTWSLSGADSGDFTITADNSGRGVLVFNSPPDFESPADADRDNTYELAVAATDDEGNSDRVDFAISVTDVNEGPVISLEGTATTAVPENTPDTQVLADYTARDPEDPTANIFRWSTAGRDGGDFLISDLGELRFRSPPDYERPADSDRDNIYEVIVRASDGGSYSMLEEPLRVRVGQVNEAPVITTKSRTEFSLRENSTAIIHTYRATDQDANDVIRWSLEGADGGDFAIYGSTPVGGRIVR